jgi:hypothetical protein
MGRYRTRSRHDGIGKKSNSKKAPQNTCDQLADLAKIVAAWPKLPEAVRRAMIALLDSAK